MIGDKIKGIVFETEGTTMDHPGKVESFIALNQYLKTTDESAFDFLGLNSGGLSWGLTGPPSINNTNTPDNYDSFTHFFPQHYNIDDGSIGQIVVNSQTQTNNNFTTSTLVQSYTLAANYTRMFTVEPLDPVNGKWGNNKWGSNSNPSLSKMIEYITTQYNPRGGYMLYCDATFWQSAPKSILT